MTSWTNQEKLSGQPSIEYDEASVEYDQADVQYNGKTRTTFTNQSKN